MEAGNAQVRACGLRVAEAMSDRASALLPVPAPAPAPAPARRAPSPRARPLPEAEAEEAEEGGEPSGALGGLPAEMRELRAQLELRSASAAAGAAAGGGGGGDPAGGSAPPPPPPPLAALRFDAELTLDAYDYALPDVWMGAGAQQLGSQAAELAEGARAAHMPRLAGGVVGAAGGGDAGAAGGGSAASLAGGALAPAPAPAPAPAAPDAPPAPAASGARARFRLDVAVFARSGDAASAAAAAAAAGGGAVAAAGGARGRASALWDARAAGEREALAAQELAEESAARTAAAMVKKVRWGDARVCVRAAVCACARAHSCESAYTCGRVFTPEWSLSTRCPRLRLRARLPTPAARLPPLRRCPPHWATSPRPCARRATMSWLWRRWARCRGASAPPPPAPAARGGSCWRVRAARGAPRGGALWRGAPVALSARVLGRGPRR